MKVKCVIVDKLPENWNDCILSEYEYFDGLPMLCRATLIRIPDITTRPEWCPLELESER
jgi:hypothetical protein